MNTMKLSDISTRLKGKLHGTDTAFTGVSIDTRTLQPGELFVALQGENFDGHNFIEQAVAKGAAAVLVSKPVETTVSSLQVVDTRLALGQMAAQRREQFNYPIIALTGSCGKTTVKEMLRSILSECGSVLANQGTLNNDIGVPLTLLKLNAEHRFAVIEMGANHPGEIAYLTELTRPTVAFINNIAPAHLEGFNSLEGVARAKSEIFAGLPTDGIALINADDAFASWIAGVIPDRKVLRFSCTDVSADVFGRDLIADDQDRYSFVLQTKSGEIKIQLPLLGRHNVLNSIAAATAALQVGADLTAIKNGLEKLSPVAGRLVTRAGRAGSRIFDDTYNANPTSIKAALQVLARYPGEKVFIMGDMGELGPTTEALHQEIGQFAKEIGIDRLYTSGRLSQLAVTAFGEGGESFADQDQLSAAVKNLLHSNMTVLVKGSRSAKMENVVAQLVDEVQK